MGSIFTFSRVSDKFLQLLCTLFDVVLSLESNNLQNDCVTLQHSIGCACIHSQFSWSQSLSCCGMYIAIQWLLQRRIAGGRVVEKLWVYLIWSEQHCFGAPADFPLVKARWSMLCPDTKCERVVLQSATALFITKCDSSVYYKVRQLCLLQSATALFITKCDKCYYKVWQYTRFCLPFRHRGNTVLCRAATSIWRNINCVQGSRSLHSRTNYISTFILLHGHGDERWPTEVTSHIISRGFPFQPRHFRQLAWRPRTRAPRHFTSRGSA